MSKHYGAEQHISSFPPDGEENREGGMEGVKQYAPRLTSKAVMEKPVAG